MKIREALTNLGQENDFLFDWASSKVKPETTKKAASLMKAKTTMKNTQLGLHPGAKNSFKLDSVDMKSEKKEKTEEQKPGGEETLQQTLSRLKAVKTPMKK